MVRSNKPIHLLPSTEHPLCHQLSTSSPPTTKNTQEHPRTPRKKDKKRMHTMSKLLEKDRVVMK
jgi:hypothetical protein